MGITKMAFSSSYLDFLPDWVEEEIQDRILNADLNLINTIFCKECEEMRKHIKQRINLDVMRGLFGYFENVLLTQEKMVGEYDDAGEYTERAFDFDTAISDSLVSDMQKHLFFENLQSDYTLLKAIYTKDLTKAERNREAYLRQYFYFLVLRLILGFKAFCGVGAFSYSYLKEFNAKVYLSLKEKRVCGVDDLAKYENGEKVDSESIFAFCDLVLKSLKAHNDAFMNEYEAETGFNFYQYAKRHFLDERLKEEYEKAFDVHDSWVDEQQKKRIQEAWASICGFDLRNIKPEYRSEYTF